MPNLKPSDSEEPRINHYFCKIDRKIEYAFKSVDRTKVSAVFHFSWQKYYLTSIVPRTHMVHQQRRMPSGGNN